MVELRWLTRKTGDRVINKYGFFKDNEITVLQYRQVVDKTIRAGMPGIEYGAPWGQVPPINQHWDWSDWKDVPTVIENTNISNKCIQCGLELEGAVGYVCNQINCPTGLGGSIA
jgi:hypothetical protein